MKKNRCCYLPKILLYNVLSFILNDLVFLGYHSQFASYPHSFASYSYRCKILQAYFEAAVRMHFNAVLSSTGAPLMERVINNNRR